MARRDRKAFRPAVAGLEVRCVPTVISPLAFGGRGLAVQRSLQSAMGHVLSGQAAPAATVAPTSTNVGNPSPSIYLDPATLTQKGLARSNFVTKSYGPYAVTQPAYVGPVREATYIGPIVSTQFLQGTMVTRIDTPAAPHDVPDYQALQAAGQKAPIDGYAALRNRNVASTGTILVLDLTVTSMDQYGRPTALSWIVDDNGSGGAYAGAAGQGTATISYFSKSHSKSAAGSAGIVWTGLINPNGVNDITQFGQPNFN